MKTNDRVRKTLRHFIPPEIAENVSSLEYQRAFFLFLTLGIIFAASLSTILVYLLIGELGLMAYAVFNCVICCISLVSWYKTKTERTPVSIIVVGLMMVNTAATIQTGGIYSVLVFNFFTPTALTLLFFDRHRMLQIFLCSVAIISIFIGLEMLGKTPKPIFLMSYNALIHGGITLALLYGMIGAFYILDAIRQESYKALQQERDSVQERIEEATRNLQDQQANISIINQHLEERNTDLQAAIQVAESAKRLQADFLRNASHEIRTPLAIIMGFGEIISDQVGKENTAAQESLKHIAEAGQNLLDIFHNILTLSTLESVGIQISPVRVHLPSMMEQLYREFAGKAEAKGIELKCERDIAADLWMMADIGYLRQTLQHLVSNAIKFTEKGTVSIAFEVLTEPEGSAKELVRWAVRDTGIGISPEFQDKLFAPFHQHDAGQTRLYGGLGLGLAISKRVVEAMNGRIWCESELGKGARFIVELPRATEP